MQKSKPNQKTQKAVPKAEAPKKDKLKKNQKPKFEEEEDEVEQEKNIDQVMEEDVEEDEKPQKPQRKANKGKKVVKEESEEEDEGDFDDDDHGVYNVDLGDDDFYIPSKKAKVDNNKAKTTKKEKIDESKMEEEKSTANKSNKEKKSNSKADRFSKKNKDEEKAQRGILYVAHLPYGFVEEGIKEFFLQYGEILNIHLARSKKTARSMGFAFIEFKYKDVAKVAADAMNGYMFYGKKLVCRVIEDDQGMRVHTKKFKFIPFNKKFIEQKNAQKEPAQVRREVKSLLKLEERRRQKLKELNIDYDFPGFKAAIEQAKQQSEQGEN